MSVARRQGYWRAEAACRELPWDLFFGPHVCDTECDGPKGCKGREEKGRFARVREAKRVCNEVCPVKSECLGWALSVRLEFGIAGGLTERERQRLLSKQGEQA